MGLLSKLLGVQDVVKVEVASDGLDGRADFSMLIPIDGQRQQQLLVQAVGLVYGQLHFSLFGSPSHHGSLVEEASRLSQCLAAGLIDEAYLPGDGRSLAMAGGSDTMEQWSAIVFARGDGELAIKSRALSPDTDGWVLDFLTYAASSVAQELDEVHLRQLAGVLDGMNLFYQRGGDYESADSPSRALKSGLPHQLVVDRPPERSRQPGVSQNRTPPPQVKEPETNTQSTHGGNEKSREIEAKKGIGTEAGNEPQDNAQLEYQDPRWTTKCPSCDELLLFTGTEYRKKEALYIRAECWRCSLTKHYHLLAEKNIRKEDDQSEERELACTDCGHIVVGGKEQQASEGGTGTKVILIETVCPRCDNFALLRFAAERAGKSDGSPVGAEGIEKEPVIRSHPQPRNVTTDPATTASPKEETVSREPNGSVRATTTQVGSIEQEYKIIATTPCSECGGQLELVSQALIVDSVSGNPCDRMQTKCSQCDYERTFVFDVSSFF